MRAFTILLIISCVSICSASQVKVLHDDSLKYPFLENPILVLYTYNTACSSCETMRKLFEEVVKNNLFTMDPLFMENDCSVNPRVCRQYRVEKFPTVLIVKKDRSVFRYTDNMESTQFIKFLNKYLNHKSGVDSISPIYIRIIILVVIVIGLVFIFLKTTKPTRIGKSDIEENAPLVKRELKEDEPTRTD